METRRMLVDEYNAISDTHHMYTIQKYQCFTVTFHTDGSEKDIPGNVEYRLRTGEPLTAIDADSPNAPELFELSTTREHLRVIH